MVSVRYPLPKFTKQDAILLAREQYGISATASALPSERDQNFHIQAEDGKEFVLKIANITEDRNVLELQNLLMAHLALHAPSLSIPRLCSTISGDSMIRLQSKKAEAISYECLLIYRENCSQTSDLIHPEYSTAWVMFWVHWIKPLGISNILPLIVT